MLREYELLPTNGRKSFYGKARVTIDDAGNQTLTSYGTKIVVRTAEGDLVRLWDGWTATTGNHIRAFCALDKAQFMRLPYMGETETGTGGRTLTNAESYAAMMSRRLNK